MRTSIAFLGLAAIGIVSTQPLSASCSTSSGSHATSAASTSAPVSTSPSARNANSQLIQELSSTPTAIKRFQRLLVQDGSLRTGEDLRNLIVFDFKGGQPANGALGGITKAASAESYPFSTGLDISLTAVFLEPCGINTPHVHPRANEFLVLVQGSNVRFGSVLENGLVASGQNQEIAGVLGQLEGTIFPQGSVHYQFNDACEKALLIAALDSNDPGTSSMAQNLFSLNADVLNATLGYPKTIDGRNFEEFRNAIPTNLAQDVVKCLARCGGEQRDR
ncbi:hypothetical protein E8E12_000578 [Didymella heteroderae]|uniref:Cupin type-1 domain-containing protein n=1 Tax=Didymella heteroderae TaxID=1769908 RepID=A0A9P4WGE7_9PLEO|nr:hypothetical protein E8E12_000578 [Didymella heteroderae]